MFFHKVFSFYFSIGYPFFVAGVSTPTGRFFPTHCMISSHEDTGSWMAGYRFLKDVAGKNPKFRMGDGAPEITKAGREVFGEEGIRLMCWSHVYRNVVPRLGEIKRNSVDMGNTIMADIESLQWSALNEETFRIAFDLLEKKYLEKVMDDKLRNAVQDFFAYFRGQWVESAVSGWWEGAHPWRVSNNQGLEGTNRVIKADHTFKRRCPLGNFFDIVSRMVNEWSKKSDSLLYESRMAMLFDPKEGLRLRTEGYQWAKVNKTGMEKVISINPSNKYTVAEAFELGSVDKIWAVNSNSNKIEKSLKERAKDRIKQREKPDHNTFQQYLDVRCSCWLLEERNGEYYCDCPVAMKGKLCHHTVGMSYLQGKLEVTSEVRSVPLGQKRKRGRPKKLPSNCLEKSPIQLPREEPVHELEPHEEQAPDVPDQAHQVPDLDARLFDQQSRRGRGKKTAPTRIAEKSAYELIRDDNIRERQALFESLNLREAINECSEAQEEPVLSNKRGKGAKRKTTDVICSPRKLRPRK